MMEIGRKEGVFPSADDRNEIAYTEWRAQNAQPKAVLQLVHGMAEYIDRYDPFARFMAEHGYAVYGHDHLGHGRTAKSAADYGYFAPRDGYKLLVEDTLGMTLLAKQENPGLPVILLGHSMGSMVVRLYADSYSAQIDGLIVMGTSGPNPAAGAGLLHAKLTGMLRGEKHPSALIDRIAFGSYTKRLSDVRTPMDWLSTNRASVAEYIADERCGFLFTASGYADLFRLLHAVSGPNWAKGIRRNLPVLLVSGKEDPVGDFGKGVAWVRDQLQRQGIESLEMILYDNMRHEILNEPDCARVYGDLLSWCERTVCDKRK